MLLVSQLTGLAILASVLVIRGVPVPGGDALLPAALGGVAGTIAIAAFYRGLAVGAMGVVAPVSATAAAVPLVVGLASGERPTGLQAAGIALALVGVAVASRERTDSSPRGAPPGEAARQPGIQPAAGVGLALISALGFGAFFVLIDRASEADPIWAVSTSRVVGIGLVVAAVAATRPALGSARGELPSLMVVGVFDMSGQLMFALASTVGLVSVVSVLASLYPVTTIVLARVVLGERVRAVQRAGALVALAGVVLITAG